MIIVNIGANNGIDNCQRFVFSHKKKVKRVHLIEPSYEALQECKKNYNGFSRAFFHNLAIIPSGKKIISIYRPKNDPLSGHSSSSLAHVKAHGHSNIENIEVDAMSLKAFFLANDIFYCDRLYLDAEGLDCEILLNFDYSKIPIQWIEFECIHTDGPLQKGEKYSLLVKKLKSAGYLLKKSSEYNVTAYKISAFFSLFWLKIKSWRTA